jgi:hypothetical protein
LDRLILVNLYFTSSCIVLVIGRFLGEPNSSIPNEVNYYPSELFAPVFLEEVTAAFDDRVRLTLGAAHPFLKDLLAASGDRISVAESGQERFFEPGQE